MNKRRLIVVGNGMAGGRFVEDLLARGGRGPYDIVVFGDEPHGLYNRILLSGVLAGTHRAEDIVIHPDRWYRNQGISLYSGVAVREIDTVRRTVTGANGVTERYDVLVLATGSRPVLPPIDGISDAYGRLRPSVFTFRTLADCTAIAGAAAGASRVAVLGGGLLGLEAARALVGSHIEVTIVHLAGHIMDAQLDADAARILARQLEQLGVRILTNRVTAGIVGEPGVAGLAFADGSTLACEVLVVAAGVTPNVEIARRAGLDVRRGIVVDDGLACRGADDVYAIGECAEHRGRLYGVVAPLWDQTRVLADRLTRADPNVLYQGSPVSTRLKVAGVHLTVMGLKEPVDDDDEVVSYAEPSRGVYKKLIVRNDRLVGAILLGDAAIAPSLSQLFVEATPLVADRARLLLPGSAERRRATDPEDLPDSARICDCNGVSKAQIVEAVLKGARSVPSVCDATRASTGCGSCRPEVERIVELACRGISAPELLQPRTNAAPAAALETRQVVTLSKIERLKQEKDGLDVLPEVPALAARGWEAIDEADRERLKWGGVFFRRQTPGRFMMRVRLSNGITNAEQIETLAEISRELGTGVLDLTTRQQIQLRGFTIGDVPEIWRRLERVGLSSAQTGMDNLRGVIGCPVAGLTRDELIDASPLVRELTSRIVGDKAFSNLPRKFNVVISGCTEHCTHSESQDLALTPAVLACDGVEIAGFNVAAGGKMGSGGCRVASPLDVFVEPAQAVDVCVAIIGIFRDHGGRGARNRARLAFLVEAWGVERLRAELETRLGRALSRAGRDARTARGSDHLGVHLQKQPGLGYVGLSVPVGRVAAATLAGVARLARTYGNGEIRLTTGQNIVLPNIDSTRLPRMLAEPLLGTLSPAPPPALRGLVACTGIDYCHYALIETKALALRTAERLAAALPDDLRFSTHWSGCPAGCGNHAMADVGLLGKNIRIDGELIEAVDVFVGGSAGPRAHSATRVLEDVPCDQLPGVLERIIPFIRKRRDAHRAAAGQAAPHAQP